MTDPTPEPPGEFIQAGEDAAAGAGEAAETASSITDSSLMKGLLSTEPATEPNHPVEFALSGVKKFLNGATEAGISGGRTAAEDFVMAAIGFMNGGGKSQESEKSEDTDTSEASAKGSQSAGKDTRNIEEALGR